MHKKTFKNLMFQCLLGLVLGLFIISASVVFTLNFRPLYYFDIGYLYISETTGYSVEEIRENYDAMIDYNELFNNEPLNFPTLAMSEGGRIHFQDVKGIFDIFGYTMIITFFISLAGILIARRRQLFTYLKIAGIIDLVLPVILSIILIFNWENLFLTFHEVVFSNDYWMFDPKTDPVINILPDAFFMHCAIMIFLIIMVSSLVCLAIAHHHKAKIA